MVTVRGRRGGLMTGKQQDHVHPSPPVSPIGGGWAPRAPRACLQLTPALLLQKRCRETEKKKSDCESHFIWALNRSHWQRTLPFSQGGLPSLFSDMGICLQVFSVQLTVHQLLPKVAPAPENKITIKSERYILS